MRCSTLATGRAASLIKHCIAAGAKFSGALSAFVLTILVARNLEVNQAGLFLLGFSIIAVLSVVFRLGLDHVVLRFLSANNIDLPSQKKLNLGLLWILIISLPFTILGMANSDIIAVKVFDKPEFESVLFWIMPSVIAISIYMLLSQAFLSQQRVVLTVIFQNLGISVLFIVTFGFLILKYPYLLSGVNAAKIYSACSVVICLVAVISWYSQKIACFEIDGLNDPELSKASGNLWLASIMALLSTWSGVLIAGALIPPNELAILSAAQRTAMLTSFVLMIVNMVVAPQYARLWKQGNLLALKKLAVRSTRAMIGIVIPVVLVMIIWPKNVMSLYGSEFEKGAFLLSILALGQFVNVSTGSAGYILKMSGHERDFMFSTVIFGPIAVILAVILTKLWGVEGAAISTALSVAGVNLLALTMVKRRLGFWLFK